MKELARELGPVIKAGTREDGARADIVFLDVNWTKIRTQPRTRKPRGLVDRRGGSILAGHLQQLGFFWRDYPVGEVDSDAFEAMPREFAVKAEPRSEMTPEAFLRKSLRRLYQPLGGAQPELELGRAYARACARVMGF